MSRTASLATTIARCILFATVCSPTAANGQVASSFRDLQGSLAGGERLTITEQSGAITTGRFVSLSGPSLRLLAESARLVDLPEMSVMKIDHLKSRKGKGALIGLIVGAVGGVLVQALSPSCTDLGAPCGGLGKGAEAPLAAAFFGGIGAAIGAGVGALKPHRQVIYLASTTRSAARPGRPGNPPPAVLLSQ